jgi:hypothetical protein
LSSKSAAKIRMDLARGHAALGEHVEALVCVERAVREQSSADGLLELIDELIEVWSRARAVACCAAAGALRDELLAGSARADESDAEEPELLEMLEAEPLAEPLLVALPEEEEEPILASAQPEEQGGALGPDLDAELAAAWDEWQAEAEPEPEAVASAPAAASRPAAGAAVDGRIRELERWLANLRDRRGEGTQP